MFSIFNHFDLILTLPFYSTYPQLFGPLITTHI